MIDQVRFNFGRYPVVATLHGGDLRLTREVQSVQGPPQACDRKPPSQGDVDDWLWRVADRVVALADASDGVENCDGGVVGDVKDVLEFLTR
jgi:hypothetical protein